MKKIFLFFLLTILSSILVYGIDQEQSLPAKVTVNPIPGTLSVSPDSLLVNTIPLSLVQKKLTFSQLSGEQDLNVTLFLDISPIKDWISFSENNFIVTPLETKDIITFLDIPNVTAGTYSGNIHALANAQDLIIPVNITVTDRYKIKVKIDALEKKVKAGNNVSVLTKLKKSNLKKKGKDVEGKITVNLDYTVTKKFKDKGTKKYKELIIATITTTMDVINTAEKTVLIPIPLNATKGKYTVEVTATHLDKTDKDKDKFSVKTNWTKEFKKFLRRFR